MKVRCVSVKPNTALHRCFQQLLPPAGTELHYTTQTQDMYINILYTQDTAMG